MEHSQPFSRGVTKALKVSTLFLIAFSLVYYLITGIRVAILGYAEAYALAGEVLLGVSIMAILAILYLFTDTIVKFLAGVANFAYFWFVPSNWIIDPLDPASVSNHGKSGIIAYFPVLQGVMWTIWWTLGIIAALGLANFIFELVTRIMTRKVARIRASKRQVIILFALIGACIPGAWMVSPLYTPLIQITPKDYQIKFNFWVHQPNISLYNNTWLNELDAHAVNLDIGTQDPTLLLQWETRCPHVTYRNIVSGWGAINITGNAKQVITTMLAHENNGTLHGWRGVCFDIEGDNFEFNASHATFEGAAQVWIAFFDWVDAVEISNRSGKDISLECISLSSQVIDVRFDCDTDLEVESMHPAYYPLDRWTTYAPMIYRCEYRDDQVAPYGSVVPGDPFNSAYEFYCDLHHVAMAVAPGQRGAYIGMTNCSCYGRDLEQGEYHSWGGDGGLWNLARDVLICKHFELPEVTFFLLYTAIEGGFSMGGVFESYGDTFLTWMNDTVNGPGAPGSIDIQHVASERSAMNMSQNDWLYDLNRVEGIVQLACFLLAALFIELVVSKKRGNIDRG